jgi:CO/xanthine dehydrogenase Mo-binding subunit
VTTYAVVGQPVTREDGPEKVSGRTCYSGDLMLPGMLWGKVLRSPFPHARIVHIDISGASKLPGVHAVLTGRDLAGRLVGRTLRDTPLLAQERSCTPSLRIIRSSSKPAKKPLQPSSSRLSPRSLGRFEVAGTLSAP